MAGVAGARMKPPPRAAAVLALLLLAATATRARSQENGEAAAPPGWAGDLAFSAGNAALGGLTAGLTRVVRGGGFWPAFRDGALGGLVAYGGRRLAAEELDGAGLLGREVGAVGASMIRNAADGTGAFQRIVLPLGPLRLHLEARGPRQLPASARIRADLPTLLATAYLALRGDTELDAGASLSSGAPVFTSTVRWADGYWAGTQAAGAIWLRGNPADPSPDAARDAVLAHERVHVLQYDVGLLLLSEPAERWLASRSRLAAWLHGRADLGLHLAPWGLANLLVPYDRRPWEQEAWFLSRVRPGG